MKHRFITLLFFSFFALSLGLGQTGSKQLSAVARHSFIYPNIQVAGDSSTFEYNSNFQTDKTHIWYFDDGPNNWILTTRFVDYSYDANGNLLYALEQRGDNPIGWENYARHKYTYDPEGHKLSESFEGWNGTDWWPALVTYWQYNNNGKVISETFEGGLVRYLYTYDAQDLLIEKTKEYLFDGTWNNLERQVFTYLPNGIKVSTIIEYKWENNAWLEGRRSTYSYDLNEEVIVALDEFWDGIAWTNGQKKIFEYDSNHNNVFWASHFWVNGSWLEQFRQFLTFDTSSDVLTTRLETRYNLPDWSLQEIVNYYYTESVPTQSPKLTDFQVFPNPANSTVIVQAENLTQAKLFDLLGRPISTHKLSGQSEETLYLGHLPAGNYLLQALDKNGATGTKPLQIRQ